MLLKTLKKVIDPTITPIVSIKKQKTKLFNFNIEEKSSSCVICYGDNSSGKSFISRLIEQDYRNNNLITRNISMKNRNSGSLDVNFIFGREGTKSTGVSSFKYMTQALKLANDTKAKNLLILDEPNLGLSKRYSKALGIYLADFINSTSHVDVFIVSHDQDFLTSLFDHINNKPSFCGVNTNQNFQEWINDDTTASLEELINLQQKADTMSKLISAKNPKF